MTANQLYMSCPWQLRRLIVALVFVALVSVAPLMPANTAESGGTSPGDRMLERYFRAETESIAAACRAELKAWDTFVANAESNRRQLREMLGLEPLPARGDLKAVVSGVHEKDDVAVENVHFQSLPRLYVTANLYRPKKLVGKAPAVLYVCGHARAVKDGVSYGNKTKYQHWGAWFARHGYVCLIIDTLQLGEIEGIHHGTYREGMWSWNSRGYTPASVEVWNSMRALDYLESRPEVDAERMGVTGRSGGGAYSWYLMALDDRIKVGVPTAGITNLKNHVLDGCVEGHCDCMYPVNTYRWDFAKIAAMAAPRPLLVANTDRDRIFPLDGVLDVYWQVRAGYDLMGQPNRIGLQIAAGPHEDLPVLQLYALQWFNQHLAEKDPVIDGTARDYFEPEQLKVFGELPADEINTRAHEVFVGRAAAPEVPETLDEWHGIRSRWMADLKSKSFGAWPEGEGGGEPRRVFRADADGLELTGYEVESQQHFRLPLYVFTKVGSSIEVVDEVVLHVLDESGWRSLVAKMPSALADRFVAAPEDDDEPLPQNMPLKEQVTHNRAVAYFAPRGIGPSAWNTSGTRATHIRRRFMLLGQTLDGMLAYDVRRAVQSLRKVGGLEDAKFIVSGERAMAVNVLYAALFEPKVSELRLHRLPHSHEREPDYLNVLRVLDVPQAVAMASENAKVVLDVNDDSKWNYPREVAERLGWSERMVFGDPGASNTGAVTVAE